MLTLGISALITDGQSWADFCKAHCRCTTEDVAKGYQDHASAGQAVSSAQYPANLYNSVMPYGVSGGEADNEPTGSNNAPAPVVQASNDVTSTGLQVADVTSAQELCSYPPLQCNSSSSCGDGGDAGCVCQITGSPFLRADTVMHLTACFRHWSGVKRRGDDAFEDERACPCNATYVSHRCCDAGADGLVWEPTNAKLGEVFLG